MADSIEKHALLNAPRESVWRAITDSRQFGRWFGAALTGPFVAGQDAVGVIAPTEVDPEIARLQEPHRGVPFRLHIEQITPMSVFAFRWRPFAIDPAHDYSAEPMTLVAFHLADAEGGVRLTLTETGFELLPEARRAAALQANDGGWTHQMGLLGKFLALQRP